MEKPEPDTQLQFLDVAALQTMFGVGRSKAAFDSSGQQRLCQPKSFDRLPHRQRRHPHQLAQTPSIKISARFFS